MLHRAEMFAGLETTSPHPVEDKPNASSMQKENSTELRLFMSPPAPVFSRPPIRPPRLHCRSCFSRGRWPRIYFVHRCIISRLWCTRRVPASATSTACS